MNDLASLRGNCLRRCVDSKAVRSLGFRHNNGLVRFETGNQDSTVSTGSEHAVGVTDHGAICVTHVKNSAFKHLVGVLRADLLNEQGTGAVVLKYDGLRIAGGHGHIAGRVINEITVGSFDFRNDIVAGTQVADGDFAIRASTEDAVAGEGGITNDTVLTDFAAGSGGHAELSAGEQLIGLRITLFDDELAIGSVGKSELDRLTSDGGNGLRLRVDSEAVGSLGLGNDDSLVRFEAGNQDSTVGTSLINAVGVTDHTAICVAHIEDRAFQHLVGVDGADLLNEQGAGAGVGKSDGLGIASSDLNGAGSILTNQVAIRCLDLSNGVVAGSQALDDDASVTAGHEMAVRGQSAGLDSEVVMDVAICADLSTIGLTDDELSAGEQLAGSGIGFFDDQFSLGRVFEGDGNDLAGLDVDGLSLTVNDVTGRSLNLSHDDGLFRFKTGNGDLSVLVGGEDAIVIAEQRTVGILNTELSTSQHLRGVLGIDLLNQQRTVRGVIKGNRDNVLRLAGDVDGLGAFNDVIAGSGLDFLDDVGASLEAGPGAHAVLVGYFLTDDRTARTGRAAEVAELEGSAGKRLAIHAVLLHHDDGGERSVLKGKLCVIVALEVNLLRRGFVELIAFGSFYFREAIPAFLQVVEMDNAVCVGVLGAEALIGSCGRASAASTGVEDFELCALNAAANDGIDFLDGNFGLLEVHNINTDFGFTGIDLELMRGLVENVVVRAICFNGNIDAGFQIGNRQLALTVRGEVAERLAALLGNLESHTSDGVVVRVMLEEGEVGLGDVLKSEGKGAAGSQFNRLLLRVQVVALGNGSFFHFVRTGRHILKEDAAGTVRGESLVVGSVDAADVEGAVGDRLLGHGVDFHDFETGLSVVGRLDRNGLVALNVSRAHIGRHRLAVDDVALRSVLLDEPVGAFRHVRDGDGSRSVSHSREEGLTVLNDREQAAGKRIIGFVLLQKLNLDLGIVLKDQRNIALLIPVEFFLLMGRGENVAFGSANFLGNVGTNRHRVPRHVGESAASNRLALILEVVVNASNTDGRTGQSHRRNVLIHLADAAAGSGNGRVRRGHGNSLLTVHGERHRIGAGVVDLVALRCLGLRYLIGSGVEGLERVRSILTSNTCHGEAGVIRANHRKREGSTGKSLSGIAGVNLLDNNLVIINGWLPPRCSNHDGLSVVIGVMLLAIRRCCITANVMIQGHVYIRPAIRVVNNFAAFFIESSGAIFVRIDVGVTGAILCVCNIHQLFGNRHPLSLCVRGNGSTLTQRAPAEGLNPSIVIPNHVLVSPQLAAELCFVGVRHVLGIRHAVIIANHHFDEAICYRLRIAPFLTNQRIAKLLAVLGAEANLGLPANIHVDDVEVERLIKAGRVVRLASVCVEKIVAFLQRDFTRHIFRRSRKCAGRNEANDADCRQKQRQQSCPDFCSHIINPFIVILRNSALSLTDANYTT